MRKLFPIVVLSVLAALAAITSLAQPPQSPDGSKPASTNVSGAQYPRVTADGRVIFRVKAPDAQKVEIVPLNGLIDNPSANPGLMENTGINGLGKGPYEMTKGADGYWIVTTPPAVPGFHIYSIRIAGGYFNDPSTETVFESNQWATGVEVPEPGVDFYLPQDVPHGQVCQFLFYSKLTQQWRRVFVYTPPGYDNNPQQRYPVLYLRHGGGQNETDWPKPGHANLILDNLIAAGKAVPMIVVMDTGYRTGQGQAQGAQSAASIVRPPAENSPDMGATMVQEEIPAIDANFRTIAGRDHRAMAGLSGGSLATLSTGLRNLGTFSALGIFSRPPQDKFDVKTAYSGVFSDAAEFNKKLHLFFWGAGTAETGIFNSVKATRAAFDLAGIKYTYVEIPGLAHEWQNWRKQLNDFAPLLFRW
jgi:enterochelin esterase-like enzyme